MRAKDHLIAQSYRDHVSGKLKKNGITRLRTLHLIRTNKTAKQVSFDPIRARALECFVNLEDTKDAIDSFENKFNGFFPPGFFTWLTPSVDGSHPPQSGRHTPEPAVIPFWIAYRSLLNKAWRLGFPRTHTTELLEVEIAEGNPESILWQLPSVPIDHKMEFLRIFDFQLAIASLAQAGWRAKVCRKCHIPFVADKAGSRFCGTHRRDARLSLTRAAHA